LEKHSFLCEYSISFEHFKGKKRRNTVEGSFSPMACGYFLDAWVVQGQRLQRMCRLRRRMFERRMRWRKFELYVMTFVW
jgi:hypothetical protein